MLVEILIFNIFYAKNLKNARNLLQDLAKKRFFKLSPKRWSSALFPEKNTVRSKGGFPLKVRRGSLKVRRGFLKKSFFVMFVTLTPPPLSEIPLVWFNVCPLTP